MLIPLAWNVLLPLRVTAAESAIDAIIKKLYGFRITTLVISNEEMKDMKVVKSLEEPDLLIKTVSETIENEAN